jgi:hypothetical protein
MNGALPEPEQEQLLRTLVEAARNVPRDQREKFLFIETAETCFLQHPGLPGRQLVVYEGDVDALEAAGLLLVAHAARSRAFDVSPLGFRAYEELQRRSDVPAQQVEEEVGRYLEADAFQRKYPEAYRKWAEAAVQLWATDSKQQLTTIGHLCREAMQAFAMALVDRYQPPDADQDKAHEVNRVQAVLSHQAARIGTTTAPFLDALLGYWKTVSRLVQRQEHGGQKAGRELVWEDGRRVVFQTAIVMFEIDHALTRPVD